LVKRLTFFVKGNVDVRDSLHFCRIGGELVWNGINEVLREHRVKTLVRIKHETWTRSDALLECAGTVPEAFTGHDLPLGPYSLARSVQQRHFHGALRRRHPVDSARCNDELDAAQARRLSVLPDWCRSVARR
jgi:hypothetical protein